MSTGARGLGATPRLAVGHLLFLVSLLLLLLSPRATAQAHPLQMCGNTGNYTANSTYQSNLARLATALSRNASSSRALFAKGSVGVLPDIAYALALCRGDATNATACGSCVAAAFRSAQQLCAFDKDATIYYDACYLRFSNVDFLDDTSSNDGELILMNNQNVTGSPAKVFDAAVRALLNATGDYAAANSTRMFATGEEAFDATYPTIYGLTQCTPDMTPADCRRCLGDILGLMPQYLSGRQGGQVRGVRCNFRYEVYPFFTGRPMIRLPAPSSLSPSPTPAPAPAPPSVSVNVTPTATPPGSKHKVLIVLIVTITVFCAVVASCLLLIARLRKRYGKTKLQLRANLPRSSKTEAALKLWRIEESASDFTLYDFSELAAATGGFSDGNKLGRGGFGPVYKGKLGNDEEIAVKRLAAHSGQGLEEFKNEIQLIAKLQHTNLVRLLGCCVQEEEKMLVYEYMPNRSLDFFIFDPHRGAFMNWRKRLHIIEGIAQGLLYLHKHSRVRIIHRDLKTSNILLDEDLNPKISDFGMARIFASNMTVANTNRIVGTYGYMAPEYASEGIFSVRSDVFSFGVLLLEIVSGKRNSGHHHHYGDFINLLGYAWQLWREGRESELIDPVLANTSDVTGILRCVKVALLCVQDNAIDRPRMTEVMEMLGHDSAVLRDPNRPPHFHLRVSHDDDGAGGDNLWVAQTQSRHIGLFSTNEMSITTIMEGR